MERSATSRLPIAAMISTLSGMCIRGPPLLPFRRRRTYMCNVASAACPTARSTSRRSISRMSVRIPRRYQSRTPAGHLERHELLYIPPPHF